MLHSEMERPAYQGSVPAVVRAVRALEHLASAQQPLALSALARTLEVGPSSLLAILTTLRSAGLARIDEGLTTIAEVMRSVHLSEGDDA